MGGAVTAEQRHEAKLDINVLQSQLLPNQRHMITEGTVRELKKFAKDPDYGEEFLETYKDHLNILSSNPKYTSTGYLSAVKFFTLLEAGNNITDSYIKVFPERLKRRTDRGQNKGDIRGEASRYNATALVNEIRKVASIPIHLIHRHILHEAILTTADLMTTAKSEMVRQKAAATLILELKPTEDNVLKVEVADGAKSAIAALHDAAEKLVSREHQSIEAGVPIKQIIEAKIIQPPEETVIEAEDIEVIEEHIEDVEPVEAGKWKF